MRKPWIWAALAVPAAPSLDETFSRYVEMQRSTQIEDVFSVQMRRQSAISRRLLLKELKTPQGPLTPEQKVEWYLRLGPEKVPLSLGDLSALRDPVLFDRALWALLREETPGSIFDAGIDWTRLRTVFGAFLKEHAPDGLFTQEHGSWWRWFRDGGVPESADPLLKALHRWFKGQTLEGQTRLRYWLDARVLLDTAKAYESDKRALSRRIFETMRETTGETPLLAQEIAEAADTVPRERAAQAILRDVAVSWEDSGSPRLSADALARVFMLAIKQGEPLDASEVLFLSDQEYRAGEFALAYEFYVYGRDKSRGSDETTRMEFAVGAARARLRSLKKPLSKAQVDETAKLYDAALEQAFHSSYRDALLSEYSNLLLESGDGKGALESALLLYRYGDEAPARRKGLELAVDASARSAAGAPSEQRRVEMAAFLEYLATARKLGSPRAFLDPHIANARKSLTELGVNSTDPLWSTLREAEAGK